MDGWEGGRQSTAVVCSRAGQAEQIHGRDEQCCRSVQGSYMALRCGTGQNLQPCHFREGWQALWAGQALIRATLRLQTYFYLGRVLQS